ncbi:MAG: zinc ribbon domain-containing protein [Candidatus Micrarchaeota archaeon]
MKYCTECGEKLTQPNPRHCPECGDALKAEPAAKPAEKQKDKDLKTRAIGWLRTTTIAILLIIIFFAIIIYPATEWERAKLAGASYYSSFTIFSNDANDLAAADKQYKDATAFNSSFDAKAKIAGNYALKASQAFTTWNYLDAFIRQNDGALRRWKVDTSSAALQIKDAKAAVTSTAQAMASDLNKAAGADKNRTAATAQTVNTLKSVGQ